MNNIIIKKLEDTTFDSNKEALDRLNELGRNDIDIEAYKDLADQVRSTCPCNCYFSTRKRYKINISYEDNYVRNRYVNPGSDYSTHALYELKTVGTGEGYIEKGNKSSNIDIESKFEKNDANITTSGQVINTQSSCPDLIVSNSINFSIRLSDDCKHWIFSYSPIWKGYISMTGSSCYETTEDPTYYSNEYLTEEIYPEVTSAYPSGKMTIVYRGGGRYQNEGSSEYYIDEETITIEATVTPLEDSVNTYNSINSLYNDLNNSLK